ncbi:hypothetical protein [Paraburkholderia fungorum]|jgi:hypothetical protein|uniref:hypothetical protein n=1 Tax=Paraburkholderia fungorum TaxID=134537 RepID=UPI000D49A352|nr:hypothetical protein [Paraburkholderia fungorum]PRZ50678.1 hypothetical protein BX589_124116 [Paraburkholderia fungorum]
MKKKLLVGLLISGVLAGCGGGGGSSGSGSGSQTTSSSSSTGTPETVSDAQIIADIQTSQASANATPIWDTSQPYNSVGNPFKGSVDGVHSYRWNIERDGLIPILDTTGRPEVTTALNNLEQAVGETLFNRLPASTVASAVTRGIIINNETPPTQGSTEPNNCGEVYANKQNMFGLWVGPDYSVNPPLSSDWQAQVNSSPLIDPRTTFNVDVDFSNAACAPMEPLVEHEMLHALGLTGHFDGFGEGSGGNCNGAICTDRAYPVLKTLYSNPPYTLISSMKIARP